MQSLRQRFAAATQPAAAGRPRCCSHPPLTLAPLAGWAAPPAPRPCAPCRAGFGGFGKAKGGKQQPPGDAAAAEKKKQQQAAAAGEKACACGSGVEYKDCCMRLHKGLLKPGAVTPEMVLRARFTAMATGNAWYLKDSSHPDNPALKGSDTDPSSGVVKHTSYEEDMAVTLRAIKLHGLEVLSAPPAAEDAPTADVVYAFSYSRKIDDRGARIKVKAPIVRSVQRAQFVRNEGQRWLLRDAVDIKPEPKAAAAAAEAAAAAAEP